MLHKMVHFDTDKLTITGFFWIFKTLVYIPAMFTYSNLNIIFPLTYSLKINRNHLSYDMNQNRNQTILGHICDYVLISTKIKSMLPIFMNYDLLFQLMFVKKILCFDVCYEFCQSKFSFKVQFQNLVLILIWNSVFKFSSVWNSVLKFNWK